MDYDSQADGNLAALARYENEQEAGEKAYEAFQEEAFEEIQDEIEESKDRFHTIRDKYGFDDSFDDFIREMF